MSSPRRRLFDEVKVGDRLPALAHDVTASTVVLGALASRDWRPMHHDHDFAVHRNGVRDIFLNTPNQAAWFERYVTDWTGPLGRIGRMIFRMQDSVFPGDRMEFNAVVERAEVDDAGCGWLELEVRLSVGETLKTSCAVRVALPRHVQDNPWKRTGGHWKPRPEAASRPRA
jgi:hypothetical protein